MGLNVGLKPLILTDKGHVKERRSLSIIESWSYLPQELSNGILQRILAYILTIKSSKNCISSSNELDSETIHCNLCWKCSVEGCLN